MMFLRLQSILSRSGLDQNFWSKFRKKAKDFESEIDFGGQFVGVNKQFKKRQKYVELLINQLF